ncbi:MAG: 30S ribosomal protein S6 [Candidatus Neomarinimicrobiota bacterium]|nr:MAG: 30S ribosomal protein S6 [Candidatus Neomarinimicrobiota bacterium]
MRYYETLYIVNPNYEADRLEAVMKAVDQHLEPLEGLRVINHRIWGKKRLAYPIEKHKYGTYVLLQFESESPEVLKDFDQFLKLEKAVLRHQTLRLERKPEVYVDEDAAGEPKPKAGEEDKEPKEKTAEPPATESEDSETQPAEDTPAEDSSPEAKEEE